MKKEKFGLLNFDSVEVLSKEEMKKVKGGYGNTDPNNFNLRYTVFCQCTNYFNQNIEWSVDNVEYSGCCNAQASRGVCIGNYPGPSHCVTLNVTTC